MSSDNPKRLLFSHFAALARVLGNEHRLELLELLAQGEQPVETLSARTGISFANVSQHLQQLRKANLVVGRREGKNVVYRLQDGPIVEALSGLRTLAEHNMGEAQDVIAQYYHAMDSMEAIGAAELASRLADGAVTLLDVRPEDEFMAGHLPNAMNVSLEKLLGRLSELPRDREIIAYCRGPYCIMSYEAVQMLRQNGFTVRRYVHGFPEWQAAGLPVEHPAH